MQFNALCRCDWNCQNGIKFMSNQMYARVIHSQITSSKNIKTVHCHMVSVRTARACRTQIQCACIWNMENAVMIFVNGSSQQNATLFFSHTNPQKWQKFFTVMNRIFDCLYLFPDNFLTFSHVHSHFIVPARCIFICEREHRPYYTATVALCRPFSIFLTCYCSSQSTCESVSLIPYLFSVAILFNQESWLRMLYAVYCIDSTRNIPTACVCTLLAVLRKRGNYRFALAVADLGT